MQFFARLLPCFIQSAHILCVVIIHMDQYIRGGQGMNVDMIFRIAAIGIIVAVLNQLLDRSGREDLGLMLSISGLVVVMVMLVREISDLFNLIKTLFGF